MDNSWNKGPGRAVQCKDADTGPAQAIPEHSTVLPWVWGNHMGTHQAAPQAAPHRWKPFATNLCARNQVLE